MLDWGIHCTALTFKKLHGLLFQQLAGEVISPHEAVCWLTFAIISVQGLRLKASVRRLDATAWGK